MREERGKRREEGLEIKIKENNKKTKYIKTNT